MRKNSTPVFIVYSNLILAAIFHLVITMGMMAAFGSFAATLCGVMLGLAGYVLWRRGTGFWRDARVGPVLGLGSVLAFNILGHLAVPPPPPPLLEIQKDATGTWKLNRGGGQLVGRTYVVIPEPGAASTLPDVLGSVKVTDAKETESVIVEWLTKRVPYQGRASYFVRPERPGEKLPKQRELATLVALQPAGTARIDVGRKEEVSQGDVYALPGPGLPGSHGYVIVDVLEDHAAQTFLVAPAQGGVARVPFDWSALKLPVDLNRVGPVKRLLDTTITIAEMAYIAGQKESATKSYRLVFDLSRGQELRAVRRLKELGAEVEETSSAVSPGVGTSGGGVPPEPSAPVRENPSGP